MSFDVNQVLNSELSITGTLIKTIVVILMAQILSWHYVRFAKVLSNKRKLARVLVFVATTTLLMISVVKTSIALSLGLVGALSIIRFRTPIKESEELAYLFLAIAVGIGVGADQLTVTIIMFAGILGYLAITGYAPNKKAAGSSLLQVTVPIDPGEGEDSSGEKELTALIAAAESTAANVSLSRADRHEDVLSVTLVVDVAGSADQIGRLLSSIRTSLPGAAVSVVDREHLI